MKYSCVFFDYGGTISTFRADDKLEYNDWLTPAFKKLYRASYRLAIISNTSRYQDAHWIRSELSRRDVLKFFEIVIASANYNMHKPDPRIFQKAIDFFQVDPKRILFVGDSRRADGGCEALGMSYLPVESGENWGQRLFDFLGDDFPSNRKLTNVFNYELTTGMLKLKIHHLSDRLVPGDHLMVGDKEYRVLESPDFSRRDIFRSKDREIVLKVAPVDFLMI